MQEKNQKEEIKYCKFSPNAPNHWVCECKRMQEIMGKWLVICGWQPQEKCPCYNRKLRK